MTSMSLHLARWLGAEDGVIGRVALAVVIIALIIVFALIALIIPGD
ncbi:MAG: hypothetical protein ACRELC_07680 [Gemmatimonadota bacterium]